MLCLGLQCKTGFAITLDSNSTADWNPMSYGFFESPHGLAFLHNLMCALHLVVGQANDDGTRNICRLLELCQLDPFVAPSYGAQHAVAANIEKAVQQFGKEERARLAKANVTLRYHALHRRNVSSTDLFGCDRRPSILPIRHQARDARKGIGQDYRPFDPKTGASRQATEVESSLNAHFDTLSCDRGCLDESSCCELLPCCCRESLQRLKGMQAAWRPIAFYSHASQTSRWSSVGLKRE
jgi:hypothetical protein